MPNELLKFIEELDLFNLNNHPIKWLIGLFKKLPLDK